MIHSRVYIVIKRPVAKVWSFLMTTDNYRLWQAGVTSFTATDGLREGSALKIAMQGAGGITEMTALVTANDGKTCYEVQSTRGLIDFVFKVQLSPVTDGTQVDILSQINAYAALKLAESALQTVSDNQNQTDLEQLKYVLESDESTAVNGKVLT